MAHLLSLKLVATESFNGCYKHRHIVNKTQVLSHYSNMLGKILGIGTDRNWADNVDTDQIARLSSLVKIYTVCLLLLESQF